jgi:hypothetical protein
MNGQTVVLVTLKGAIESLLSREQDLTHLERLKLRSLRLNLDVVQGPPAEIFQLPGRAETALDPLAAKLRSLQAMSRETLRETRLLLAEAQSHVKHGRSLCDSMRLAVERHERLRGAKRRPLSERAAK